MIATIDFDGATPSENCKFLIRVDDGYAGAKTYDSDGTTTEVAIERLPVKIEIREQYAGASS